MSNESFKGRSFVSIGSEFKDIGDTDVLNFRGDSFVDKGDHWFNCGASQGQEASLTADQNFQKAVTAEYTATVGANTAILQDLTTNLEKTFNAGPNQQGLSPAELAVENSQALNNAAASNKNIQAAIGEKAAMSSATPGVESGVTQALRAQAATSVENNLSNEQASITARNYDIGRENYNNAAEELIAAPSALENPINQAAGEVTGANKATSDQANANAAANQAWMGLVTNLAGDAASGFGAYEGGKGK